MTAPAASTEAASVERVSTEVPADDEAVTKALDSVNSIVSNIESIVKAGAAGAVSGAPEATEGGDGGEQSTEKADKADDDKDEKTEKAGPREAFKATLTASGVKGVQLEKAMAEFDKRFDRGQKFPSAQPPLSKGGMSGKVKKSEGGEGDAPAETPEAAEPLTADSFLDMVEKAKRFTPERIKQLKAAVDTLKLVLEGVEPGGNPKNSLPDGGQFGASGISSLSSPEKRPVVKSADEVLPAIVETLKGLESTLKEAFGEQSKVVKGLQDKIETIEKTRNPSNSVDGDGGTDTETTKKGLWAGVL